MQNYTNTYTGLFFMKNFPVTTITKANRNFYAATDE